MRTPEEELHHRGNRADYVLGTREGWGAFNVVRWHAVEEISRPFTCELTLLRDAPSGPVDLDALLDSGATFRIATEGRWRSMHGIVAEAEEVERTGALLLYRVLFVPPIWRARFRRRCRSFVGKTLIEILTDVLENRAPRHRSGLRGLSPMTGSPAQPDTHPSFDQFVEPEGTYRFSLVERSRADEPRAQVVQYNESDFDFLSRLLEEEGLSYFFEHTQNAVVLTITDRPGFEPMFERDRKFEMRGIAHAGSSRDQEVIRTLRMARRMRSRGVTMRDYAWRKSRTRLEASVHAAPEMKDDFIHFEFPARDEDEPRVPGQAPAQARMDRFEIERALCDGSSTVRTMQPGYRFQLHDIDGLRDDVELLIVRVETFATELLPEASALDLEPFGFPASHPPSGAHYENRFQAIPAHMIFRPSRQAPKPRIHGVETARVTAEEVTGPGSDDNHALHSDELGRVRIRFPWDQRENDGTPTSKWVRVAQHWAGAGYGTLYVPRVGHEVLVAYEQGDPDRPIILGRVYNQQNQPPYTEANSTISTLKSASATGERASPEDGFNEFRFEDKLGAEQIYLHAQKDLTEVVLANHSTSVGGDQSNSVQGNQSDTVKGNQTNKVEGDRFHTIVGQEVVYVGKERRTIFDANEIHLVETTRETMIGASEKLTVSGPRETFITGNDQRTVGAGDQVSVKGKRFVLTGGDHHLQSGGSCTSHAASDHKFVSTNAHFEQSSSFSVDAAGCTLTMSPGMLRMDNGAGACIALVGGIIVIHSGGAVLTSAGGPLIQKSGGPMYLTGGGDINATAPAIKLNG